MDSAALSLVIPHTRKNSPWIACLAAALFALVRGSGMLVIGAKQVGASLGVSKFAIGVLIVGFCGAMSIVVGQ